MGSSEMGVKIMQEPTTCNFSKSAWIDTEACVVYHSIENLGRVNDAGNGDQPA